MAFQPRSTLEELTAKVRNGRISRRTFLERTLALGVGSGAALSLLEACGTTSQANVTYWNLFGGGDGVRMVQMQNDFKRTYPNIGLEAITLAWGAPYYTKLAMSAVGGRPPDVGIAHMSRMYTLAQGNLLDPLDLDELAQFNITPDRFLPGTWDRAHYNGKLYAIPLDTHPFVMYYNTDVCQKAGLLDADGKLKPFQGPDEAIKVFKAAQQVTGNLGLSSTGAWRLFNCLYSQMKGAPILTDEGRSYTMDEGKAEQALAFMANLTTQSKVASPTITSDGGGSIAVFGSGKAGFLWDGEWDVTTFLNETNFKFDMVPFPNIFGGNQTWADSHTFILPRQLYPDKNRRMATLQFISFLLKDSLTWAKGGHIPAYQPVATSSEYKQLVPQSHYASAAANVVPDPPAWYSGAGSQFEAQADNAFQAVLSAQLTPKQAIQEFRAGIQKLIKTPSPI